MTFFIPVNCHTIDIIIYLIHTNHMILPVIAGKTINVPKKHTNTARIQIQIRFTIAHVLILVSADWPGLAIAKIRIIL